MIEIKQYAPVIITVYTRKQNLENLINSLLLNPEAKMTDVYIISDAASKTEDEEAVNQVREYMKTITGFNTVNLIMPEENSRITKKSHLIPCRAELLSTYKKIIFLEDDNVVSKHFLKYMNEALEFYKDSETIRAISAFHLPIKIPFWYKKKVYLGKRFSPWGYGITEKWFNELDMSPWDRYSEAIKPKNIKKFKYVGNNILEILKLDSTGKIKAGDVRICYQHIMKNQYTLFPTISLVRNVGFDGSGEHCESTDRFLVNINNENTYDFDFSMNLKLNNTITRRFRDYQNGYTKVEFICSNLKNKFVSFSKSILKSLGLFNFVKKIFSKKDY